MPLPLLLTAAATATASVTQPLLPQLSWELLGYGLTNAAFLWGIFTWRLKRSEDKSLALQKEKEEAQVTAESALEKRFSKLDKTDELHAKQLHASQEQHNEHVRFRDLKVQQFESRLDKIERDQRGLENLPARVQNLESKFEMVLDKMSTINESQTEMKADLKELVKAVAKITP